MGSPDLLARLLRIDKEQTGRWKTPFCFIVRLNVPFLGNTFDIVISPSRTQPLLPLSEHFGPVPHEELCATLSLEGNEEDRDKGGMLQWGKGGMLQWGKGKLENEEGSRARAAAKLFKTAFSTGLIVLPHGAETPMPRGICEVCVSLQPVRETVYHQEADSPPLLAFPLFPTSLLLTPLPPRAELIQLFPPWHPLYHGKSCQG